MHSQGFNKVRVPAPPRAPKDRSQLPLQIGLAVVIVAGLIAIAVLLLT